MANRHEDSFIFNKIRMFLENCKFNYKLKIQSVLLGSVLLFFVVLSLKSV